MKKDKHGFKPWAFSWTADTSLCYRWVFTDQMIYDLGNSDQCDLLKLTGASFGLLSNHNNSLMASFRWDTDGFWVVAPYAHVDGQTVIPSVDCSGFWDGQGDDHVRVFLGDTLETHLFISKDDRIAGMGLICNGDTIRHEQQFNVSLNRWREIFPWFGGSSKAPHKMCVLREPINH